ncbi:hypothetical protein PHMEG_00020361 [Phytophthora megakarya]|uniref:PiggyBac transposable element-derived protein domain-containing protein n=1 Tax=Phytophthora megakarya TaxID=4795 RepID=A0A225VQU6_9STRA|nr:hypothetical protein PHMEG_00020361 [Phytophthora megakarya]
MARHRFMHLSRNLHFSRNDDVRARTDRAWKLRPIIDALQDRFTAGYIPPAIMAFDEAMLPPRSTFNRMRVYMKDKPHKWGTKLFMLCCSTTAYCIRFEVYCGKKERSGGASSTDYNRSCSRSPANGSMRRVVTDRFYSAVPLSMQLLTMGFYSIGTVRTDRLGLSSKLIPRKKKDDKKKVPKIPKNRPSNIERGTYTVAKALQVPDMKVLRWWDTRSVHMLSTSGSIETDRIVRRDKLTGEQLEVACPRIVKDYQTYMGVWMYTTSCAYKGKLCITYKKYYKSLLLGLVDLAIINIYIVYSIRQAAANLPKLSHVKFLKQLHLELCQLHEEDWLSLQINEYLQVTPSKRKRVNSRQAAHEPVQNDEWRSRNNQQGRKRRTRACKVCSLLKGTDNAKGGDSSVYCSECKLPHTSKKPMAWRVFLCEKVRHTVDGAAMSCFDIWHKAWRNGTLLPKKASKRKILARTPACGEGTSEEKEEELGNIQSPGDEPTTGGTYLPKRTRLAPDAATTD